MREILAMHARSHKLQGSDPLEFNWSHIVGRRTSSLSVTADTECTFTGGPVTNDRRTFAWAPTDAPGLLVSRDGVYMAFASVQVASGSQAVARSIQIQTGLMSGGAFSGSEFGADNFRLGGGTDTGMLAVTATSESKAVLSHIAIQGYFGVNPEDPQRIVLLLDHQGGNYTVANAALWVARISDFTGGTPPLPYDATP